MTMPLFISAIPMIKVNDAIEKLSGPVRKYDWIMKNIDPLNPVFQANFKNFYVVRRRTPQWSDNFFKIFDDVRTSWGTLGAANPCAVFEDVLGRLKSNPATSKYVEKSFASKMLHTLNPSLPIIDKEVLKQLGYRNPYNSIPKSVQLYEELIDWYATALSDPVSIGWIDAFNNAFPGNTYTNVKRIDFLLWQMR